MYSVPARSYGANTVSLPPAMDSHLGHGVPCSPAGESALNQVPQYSRRGCAERRSTQAYRSAG